VHTRLLFSKFRGDIHAYEHPCFNGAAALPVQQLTQLPDKNDLVRVAYFALNGVSAQRQLAANRLRLPAPMP